MVVKLVWNAVWWLVNTNFRFLYMFSVENLPMLNDVERSLGQGNMFTGMCLSTGGGACSWGVPGLRGVPGWGCLLQGGCLLPGGCLVWWGLFLGGCLVETPGWLLLRAVRIPLECILVIYNEFYANSLDKGMLKIATKLSNDQFPVTIHNAKCKCNTLTN